jgi:hypothetical protein
LYFVVFVLFCAANQYSWLQPSTGFRYLVPVVPGLALLAMQGAQALPRWLRRSVATVACGQSLLMALAYQSDVRLVLETLWQRRFEPAWMVRLAKVGVPVTWAWAGSWFLLLGLVLAAIWLVPPLRAARSPNSLENRSLFFSKANGPAEN